MPPSIPSTDADAALANREILPTVRRVIHYSGLNYFQAMQLPADLFLLMAKNDFVEELNQSEEGREYLAKCKRLATTDIDIEEKQAENKTICLFNRADGDNRVRKVRPFTIDYIYEEGE